MNTYPTITIKHWAEEDRPREKLMLKGRAALSNVELIAIILGSGTPSLSAVEVAKQILNGVGNDLSTLSKLSVKDLMKFKGVGEAKAINIIAAIELGRRKMDAEPQIKPKIACSQDVYDLMKSHLLDLSHEEFWVILLSRNNSVLKKLQISSGGVSGTVADPKIIFNAALQELASSIILVHNHPSGNKRPSEADIALTKKIKQAGQVLDVSVLDHLIFTDHTYFSFADEAMM